jgi:hypothetical protein
VVELKTINTKKATKEIRGGKDQSPFDKMLKQYKFIYILLRKDLAERRTPLDNILALKRTLNEKIEEIVLGTLTE